MFSKTLDVKTVSCRSGALLLCLALLLGLASRAEAQTAPATINASREAVVAIIDIAITPVIFFAAPRHDDTTYSITPALPSGLELADVSPEAVTDNPNIAGTATISGTPTEVADEVEYTITATNPGGSFSRQWTLTVQATFVDLVLSASVVDATVGTAITPVTITLASGDADVSYSIDPPLPSGLMLDTDTGTISGTPAGAAGAVPYTITATTADGIGTATMTILVNFAAPVLSASPNAQTATVGIAITPVTITSSGGAVSLYGFAPELANGLVFDDASGTISGSPTAAASEVTYTITGTNATGSDTTTVMITVNNPTAPIISASVPTLIATAGTAITDITIDASAGGAVASYSIDPAIGNGLAFDTGTGTISGSPTAVAGAVEYTITGTNVDGMDTATVTITVTATLIAPVISASVPTLTATAGTAITNITIDASAGGAVASYSIDPAIANGLTFNTTSGTISGTPTAVAGAVEYTITATNASGSAEAEVTITVNAGSVPDTGSAPNVGIPDPTPLVLTPDFGEEGLILLLGETQEITISGGTPPYRAVLSSDDSITVGEIVDGTTLRITGVNVNEGLTTTLSIQDLRTDSVPLEVVVYAPPVLNLEDDDGTPPTKPVFRGGVSSDGGSTYFQDGPFSVGDVLDIIFVITPRDSDIGEQVSIVVGARMGPTGTIFFLTESGLLEPYDGETLISYQQDVTLAANNLINITPEPITLTVAEVGNWDLVVGYQLANGDLFYHREPLKMEVTR